MLSSRRLPPGTLHGRLWGTGMAAIFGCGAEILYPTGSFTEVAKIDARRRHPSLRTCGTGGSSG